MVHKDEEKSTCLPATLRSCVYAPMITGDTVIMPLRSLIFMNPCSCTLSLSRITASTFLLFFALTCSHLYAVALLHIYPHSPFVRLRSWCLLMIDIHCHILPGMDDGSAELEATMKMLRIAEDDGIGHIMATPH